LSPGHIGVIFFFNTSTIVTAQLVTLHFMDGKSRTRILGVVGVCWASFWLLVGLVLHAPFAVAITVLCAGMVVFALGETLLSPVGPAIVNGIAPEHLRGRYNAFAGLVWGLSGAVAPVVTGLFLQSHLASWWPYFVAALALLGGIAAMSLRWSLTPEEDGRVLAEGDPVAS
jgi:MFS family permease